MNETAAMRQNLLWCMGKLLCDLGEPRSLLPGLSSCEGPDACLFAEPVELKQLFSASRRAGRPNRMDRRLAVPGSPRWDCDPKEEAPPSGSAWLPVLSCPVEALTPRELGQSVIGKTGHSFVVSERPSETAVGCPADRTMRADPVMAAAHLGIHLGTCLSSHLR